MLKSILQRARFQRKPKIAKSQGDINLEFLSQFIPDDPVVLEAGAHVGADTLEMARRWPTGTIHAFEPVRDIFEQLQRRTAGFNSVQTYNLALGARVGIERMYVSSGASDGSSSLLPPTGHEKFHPTVLFQDNQLVDCSTIGAWASKFDVKNIDFMWLDMQGGEMNALKHAGEILKSVKLIYSEVSLLKMYEDAPLYGEFRVWMNKQGFHVIREDLPWKDMGNVAFLRV